MLAHICIHIRHVRTNGYIPWLFIQLKAFRKVSFPLLKLFNKSIKFIVECLEDFRILMFSSVGKTLLRWIAFQGINHSAASSSLLKFCTEPLSLICEFVKEKKLQLATNRWSIGREMHACLESVEIWTNVLHNGEWIVFLVFFYEPNLTCIVIFKRFHLHIFEYIRGPRIWIHKEPSKIIAIYLNAFIWSFKKSVDLIFKQFGIYSFHLIWNPWNCLERAIMPFWLFTIFQADTWFRLHCILN